MAKEPTQKPLATVYVVDKNNSRVRIDANDLEVWIKRGYKLAPAVEQPKVPAGGAIPIVTTTK